MDKIHLEINGLEIELKKSFLYLVESPLDFTEEYLVKHSKYLGEYAIINHSPYEYESILLQPYFSNRKSLLQKHGLDFKLGVTDFECLKILILNELSNFETIFINTAGFDSSNIERLRKYLQDLTQKESKTIFLVDSNKKDMNLRISDSFSNLINSMSH